MIAPAPYRSDPEWIAAEARLNAALNTCAEFGVPADKVGAVVSATMDMRVRETIFVLGLQETIDYVAKAINYAVREGGGDITEFADAQRHLRNLELATRVTSTVELEAL